MISFFFCIYVFIHCFWLFYTISMTLRYVYFSVCVCSFVVVNIWIRAMIFFSLYILYSLCSYNVVNIVTFTDRNSFPHAVFHNLCSLHYSLHSHQSSVRTVCKYASLISFAFTLCMFLCSCLMFVLIVFHLCNDCI